MKTMTDTQEAAFAAIEPHVDRLEAIVLDMIRRFPKNGVTCDEIESFANLSHQTASARITALKKRELIIASEERRLTRSGRKAIVWKPWGLI